MHTKRLLFLSTALLSLVVISSKADDLIWIEGEDASSSTMKKHGWYDSVKKGELSGGEWLSHFGNGDMPEALYVLMADTAGDHHFWLRANPVGAELSVRLNEGQWQKIDLSKNEQNTNIASDGKPDLRFVAWVNAGTLTLKRGENTLDVRFESGNNRHGGLDCLVLSRTPFLPQGNKRPGVKTGMADPGTWAFEPDRDSFSKDSLLDLRALNELPAGKSGYVKRSNDGADFVDGAGKPIRFWAVNTGVQRRDELDAVKEHARWLAKRGVNMVRHHGHLPPGKGSALTDVNQKDIDAAWRLVAAMREKGIYTTISPYWASHTKPESTWGLDSADNDSLTGLIFFDETLQAAYKEWLRALLVPQNPHTGISLAKDPSVAIFQIQNEDSLLFWTEGSIKGKQRLKLAALFGTWLKKKHGSMNKATAAWGGDAGNQGDDFSAGIVMPHMIWHMTQSPNPALANRLGDQLAFYTELMFDFNKEIARFLKEDIGYAGLVNAGNWRTADAAKLLDAERYAYSANDVIGVNRYYNGGSHENPSDKSRAGYLISQGDIFSGESVLKRPWDFPLALRQVSGHPMIISESAWVPPLRYQSEGPFLVAAYGALTGFDIFYWFATDDTGFGPPMDKWQLSTPAQIGMFPAAALMFRQGYIEKADPVLVENRSTDELWTRKPPLLPEESGYDPNRDQTPPSSGAEAAKQGSVTPLAYLTGPVEIAFKDGPPKLGNLKPLIDSENSTVKSATGQLLWNHKNGVCTLDAPKAQGAVGVLSEAGIIRLSTLSISSKNDYASLLAVSMDGADLSKSKRILLQVGTTARPHGWKTSPLADGKQRIENLGSSPWNIENSETEIMLANPSLTTATQLDANGIPVGEISVKKTTTHLRLKFPADAMYILLR